MLEQEFFDNLIKENEIQPQTGSKFIYYNNIISARIEALIDIFPAVNACLSEEYVRHIAQDFAEKYASFGGNLNLYGKEFSSYLADLAACKPYPYLRDLADFEYTIRKLLYAKDDNALSVPEFTEALQNNESPILISAALGFNSEYDVAALADYALGRTVETPKIQAGSYYYFLYRDYKSMNIFVKVLNASQFELIPILVSSGVSKIDEALLQESEIVEFIQFLIHNNLFTIKGAT